MHTVGHTHINTLIIWWIFCRYIVLEGSQYTKSSRFICIHGEDPNQLIWLTLLVRWLYNWLVQLIWWYNIIVWYDVIRVTWNQDWWFMAVKGVINWDKSLIYVSVFRWQSYLTTNAHRQWVSSCPVFTSRWGTWNKQYSRWIYLWLTWRAYSPCTIWYVIHLMSFKKCT